MRACMTGAIGFVGSNVAAEFASVEGTMMRHAIPYDTSPSTDQTVARLGTTPLTKRQILWQIREERETTGVLT